eukprot:2521525-Rhodomonas_salina.6
MDYLPQTGPSFPSAHAPSSQTPGGQGSTIARNRTGGSVPITCKGLCWPKSEHRSHFRGSQRLPSQASSLHRMHPGWRQYPVLASTEMLPAAQIAPHGQGRHHETTPAGALRAVPTKSPTTAPFRMLGDSNE